jgi:hypothetical protein
MLGCVERRADEGAERSYGIISKASVSSHFESVMIPDD